MLKRFLISLMIVLLSCADIMAKNDSLVEQKKHSPKRATLYSAVLPGLGQAYNKKYWKIPVVYAGIGTIFYIANTNGNNYNDYRKAYDFKTGTTTDVNDDIKDIADRYSAENLISLRDYYRRNMELSWIIMALWYGINIIDAAVDAHFFEYDIGDDLSLKIEPMIQNNYGEMAYGYGRCARGVSLKLKF